MIMLWVALTVLTPEVKPLPGNKACAYPAHAQKVQVVGPVVFTAQVRPDGSVESVAVTQVPHPGLDFEDAVKACVRAWRRVRGRGAAPLRGKDAVPPAARREGRAAHPAGVVRERLERG
jgi:hypothetical protein